MLRGVVGLGLCSLLATACSAPSVFGCDADTQCTQDGAAGTCELNGFCSFDDVMCDSGRRYGSLAGNGLAERCVLDPDEASGTDGAGSTTTVSATGTTTSDPASTSLTSSAPTSSSGPVEDATGEDSSTSGDTTDRPMAMPEDGLVLRFSFEEPAATNVGAYDLSGNELDATCGPGECPEQVPGIAGNGVSFDGITDRLEVADHSLLRQTEALSISVWVFYDGDPGLGSAVGKPFAESDRNSYELYVDHQMTPQMRFGMDSNPGGEAYVSNDPLFVGGEWKHIVGTYDNGAMVLYIDNVVAAEGVGAEPRYDGQPLTIGGDISGAEFLYYWRGAIDEVRIYDRALTHGEVEVLFGEYPG